jgi:hypothetical protein
MTRATPIQFIVGIDFGTAYTKVMIRNAVTDEVVALRFSHCGKEDLFLPSVLFLRGDQLVHPVGIDTTEDLSVVPYLKMALTEKCRSQENGWADLIESCNGGKLPFELRPFIEALVACYLVDVVQLALNCIYSRWNDFGSHAADKVFFQMSLPAQDAQEEELLKQFRKCLHWAVSKAQGESREQSLPEIQHSVETQADREDCFFLAEVTANVMTYRSSRAGRPGVYLFVDVGAGTVDLSVFHYPEPDYFGELQNYAAAKVSMTGSGHVETRALRSLGNGAHAGQLEELKACKEGTAQFPHLSRRVHAAKLSLLPQLESDIRQTLAAAKDKFVRNEFISLVILAGGGGWCVTPYRKAAVSAVRAFGIEPEIRPLPQPDNSIAIWGASSAGLASRFSVAHGLSYPFWTWPEERYPDSLENIAPTRRSRRTVNPAHEDDG